jgi:hypothetical protein
VGSSVPSDNLIMTSVEGTWSCTVDVGRQDASDGFYYLTADVSALIMQDAAGNVIDTEFSPMSVRI